MKSYVFASIVLGLLALSPKAAHCEEVVKTTVCQVIADPPAFNHKLLELTGYASEGMERFSLSAKGCQLDKNNMTGIWLEYGGPRRSGAKYCCGASTYSTLERDLVVEGVTTSLIDDDNFRAFDARVYPVGTVKATLIGRFFAGSRQEAAHWPGVYLWGGYGHFGMYTLLVIQQVVSVEAHDKASRSPAKGDR